MLEETTKDGKFTLEITSCLGVCGVAPAMMLNDEMFGNLTPEKGRHYSGEQEKRIMNLVRNHVLISIDAGTIMAGARAVEKALIDEIAQQGLRDEIAVLETGSIGTNRQRCRSGCLSGRYVITANVTPSTSSEFVEEHLLKGRPLARLLLY